MKLKDRRIYTLNRSHAITIPVLWLESWGGEIGSYVHVKVGDDGELILTPVKEKPSGDVKIDTETIVKTLEHYWLNGDGKRNELTLAITGFIAECGGSEDDATFIISELARMTGKGRDHVSGAKYAFHREVPVRGINALEQLMDEIEESTGENE